MSNEKQISQPSVFDIIIRIITMPFFIILLSISYLIGLFVASWNYLYYGGEVVTYNKLINRVTLSQIFLLVEKKLK